ARRRTVRAGGDATPAAACAAAGGLGGAAARGRGRGGPAVDAAGRSGAAAGGDRAEHRAAGRVGRRPGRPGTAGDRADLRLDGRAVATARVRRGGRRRAGRPCLRHRAAPHRTAGGDGQRGRAAAGVPGRFPPRGPTAGGGAGRAGLGGRGAVRPAVRGPAVGGAAGAAGRRRPDRRDRDGPPPACRRRGRAAGGAARRPDPAVGDDRPAVDGAGRPRVRRADHVAVAGRHRGPVRDRRPGRHVRGVDRAPGHRVALPGRGDRLRPAARCPRARTDDPRGRTGRGLGLHPGRRRPAGTGRRRRQRRLPAGGRARGLPGRGRRPAPVAHRRRPPHRRGALRPGAAGL
ncbi:MAG: hypothetical protein AVDCRST_MAG41-2583, partial [uncultured Corynebacteriales bacterium]